LASLAEGLHEEVAEELQNDTIVEVPGQDRIFIARVIQAGERYGRNRVLLNNGQPLVCFFDSKNRFPEGDVDEQHYGQATGGQYHLETLLAHDPASGLDLYGGVDVWKVPAESMPALLAFLSRQRKKPIRDRLSPLAERAA
jgi:hypothetical protein